MKKLIALLMALALVFSLAACGGSADQSDGNQGDGQPQGQSSQPEEDSTPVEEIKPAGPVYEITHQNAKVWVNSIGTTWVQTIIEITNTGSENLYLSPGSYDLEDSDGNLVTSRSTVSTYPDVLAPGEKGYMYEETTLDDYSGDGNLTVLPRPDIELAKVDLIRYDVTDVTVSNDTYSGVKVLGRVENTTDETGDGMIYIVAFFYDESGTPIGSAFTILTDTLESGAKVGFEFSGFSLPDDITADSVASNIIYAYPSQFQF